MHRILVLEL